MLSCVVSTCVTSSCVVCHIVSVLCNVVMCCENVYLILVCQFSAFYMLISIALLAKRVLTCLSPNIFSQSERHNHYSARKSRRVAAMFPHKPQHSDGAKDWWISKKTLRVSDGPCSSMTRDVSPNQMRQTTFM